MTDAAKNSAPIMFPCIAKRHFAPVMAMDDAVASAANKDALHWSMAARVLLEAEDVDAPLGQYPLTSVTKASMSISLGAMPRLYGGDGAVKLETGGGGPW